MADNWFLKILVGTQWDLIGGLIAVWMIVCVRVPGMCFDF